MRCASLMTHSLTNLNPSTKCGWCKKSVKEIKEFEEWRDYKLFGG